MNLYRWIIYRLEKRKKQRIYNALVAEQRKQWMIVKTSPITWIDHTKAIPSVSYATLLMEENVIGERRLRVAENRPDIKLDQLNTYHQLKQWELAAEIKMPPRHAMEYDL